VFRRLFLTLGQLSYKKEKKFEEIIARERDRKSKKRWTGSLLDYLEIVKKDPSIAKLSHQRIYDTIRNKGTSSVKDDDNPKLKKLFKDDQLLIYNFFKGEFGLMVTTI